MQFNKRLREARMYRQITQNSLAEAVGVALRTYQCYEEGRREPRFEVLVALADELDVSIDYLLGRTDEYMRKEEL